MFNVAGWDRIRRVALGLAILATGLAAMGGTWGAVIGPSGLILLATGFAGNCPVDRVLKFRTLKKLPMK